MHYELLKKVVVELTAKLTNARVAKIHQPAADVLIFRLWTGRENLRLLLSADPKTCRIHLAAASYPNPFTPPRFCQLLRARVSRILSIELLNDDRIVSLHCAGPKGETCLIVELTGTSSNMLLLDDNNSIIDVLRRVTGDSSRRQIVPGQPYRLPEKNQAALQRADLAMEEVSDLSFNESVDKLYTQGQLSEKKSDLTSVLKKSVTNKRKKLQRRLKSIAEEQLRQADAEQYKQSGELLLANLHSLSRGMESVEIFNYYRQPPEPSTVLLDDRLSPQENAERYFKRYKKAKRGREHSHRRLQETQAELDWLDSIDYLLKDAVAAAEIEEIAAECWQNGLLKEAADRYAKKPQNVKSPPLEAVSPNGFKVLWGRNNRQNDYLTTKVLAKNDLWFHVHRSPGSHVLLSRGAGQDGFAEEDILFAASIAAGYSRSKDDNKVEVMLVEPKFLKKPKGCRPGLVAVQRHKTIIVQPFRLHSL